MKKLTEAKINKMTEVAFNHANLVALTETEKAHNKAEYIKLSLEALEGGYSKDFEEAYDSLFSKFQE